MKELTELFKKYNNIVFAYLFGSTINGKARADSDVDIAICLNPKEDFDINNAFNLRLDLMNELEKYFQKKVEVVILNTAPILLKYEVLTGGKSVYSTDEDARFEFESLTRRLYFDFKYLLSIHTKSFLNQLREKKLDECSGSNRFKT